jgi:hypothetical protein
MLIEELLTVYTYDHAGLTTSHAQAKAWVDDILSQPYEQEWVAHHEENYGLWAHVLERKVKGLWMAVDRSTVC